MISIKSVFKISFFFTILLLLFSGCVDRVSEAIKEIKKDRMVINDSSILKIDNSRNLDLFVIMYDEAHLPSTVKKISLSEIINNSRLSTRLEKKTLADDIEMRLKCSYAYIENSWYIKNEHTSKCTKDEAIQEINSIVLVLNEYLKVMSTVMSTWK